MSIEGELRITLQCKEDHVSQVEIKSTRPLQLTRLFNGKTVDELLTMIPMLYSVCGTAQSAAAVKACRLASRLDISSKTALLEQMLVNIEMAREHLWRILTDWSTSAGGRLDRDLASSLASLINDSKMACFPEGDSFRMKPVMAFDSTGIESIIRRITNISSQSVFGLNATVWYEIEDTQALNHWLDITETDAAQLLRKMRDGSMARVGDGEALPLPEIDHYAMSQRLSQSDADAFIATPEWGGQVYETGPLTRQNSHPMLQQLMQEYGNGVYTRMVARLLELASLPGSLERQLNALKAEYDISEQKHDAGISQQGIGEVEAARGRLFHRVVVQDGVVSSYQILAPTEWNFHPLGVVARGLKRLSIERESVMKQQAELLINAVDPCVGFSLEIG
ncbi:MAG: nickel-dependent hydrogenase large subunit [Candidatus Thiodiazotropha sp. DIVDIV]